MFIIMDVESRLRSSFRLLIALVYSRPPLVRLADEAQGLGLAFGLKFSHFLEDQFLQLMYTAQPSFIYKVR